MKIKLNFPYIVLALLALGTLGFQLTTVHAQGTAFTYEGQLQNNSNPANGTYDFTFTLFDTNAAGMAVGVPLTNNDVLVANGLFTVQLDFGAGLFTGTNYWLDISVSPAGSNTSTELTPRQQILPVPYAIMANSASNLLGALPVTQLPSNVVTNNQTSMSLGDLTLNGTLHLSAATTTNLDIIYSGTNTAVIIGGATTNLANVNESTFLGLEAGNLNMSGNSNTAVGYQALHNNTSGSANTAIGSVALFENTSGSDNTANGFWALCFNTTGYENTASGVYALENNTSGDYNTANGYEALQYNTSGYENTANGRWSLLFNSTGNDNTAAGDYSLEQNTTGNNNTAVGEWALENSRTGSQNTASGQAALSDNTTGSYNTANGWNVLNNNITGSFNTANGANALGANTTGIENAANGGWALVSNTNGSYNTANGEDALHYNVNGSNNVANGFQSLYHNIIGTGNTANGVNALLSNTNGNYNIADGYEAGMNITTGSSNIDIGNFGVTTDNNIIRIGTSQAQAFITGQIVGNGSGLTNLNADTLTTGASIGLGIGNSISTINSAYSFVGGGQTNSIGANSTDSVIGGGQQNQSTANYATVGGGSQNTSSGQYSTVSGGQQNSGSGDYATIPGGCSNAATAYAFAAGSQAQAVYSGAFVWSDGSAVTTSTTNDQFMVRASGGVVLYSDTNNDGIYLAAGSGTWSSLSDRNAKNGFVPVAPQQVLAKVAALPLTTWSYKTETGVQHIGPMAQDFYAAFRVGEDNKHITDLDESGVALAAIQGLNEKLNEKDAEIQNLEEKLDELQAKVKQLAANK